MSTRCCNFGVLSHSPFSNLFSFSQINLTIFPHIFFTMTFVNVKMSSLSNSFQKALSHVIIFLFLHLSQLFLRRCFFSMQKLFLFGSNIFEPKCLFRGIKSSLFQVFTIIKWLTLINQFDLKNYWTWFGEWETPHKAHRGGWLRDFIRDL